MVQLYIIPAPFCHTLGKDFIRLELQLQQYFSTNIPLI
jgi:hypothetical protein